MEARSSLWREVNRTVNSTKPELEKPYIRYIHLWKHKMISWSSACLECRKPWVWSPPSHRWDAVAHVYNPILSDWPRKVRRKAIVFTRGKNRNRGEYMYENVKDQFLCILSKKIIKSKCGPVRWLWVQVLSAKPNHLSSIPETHVVKGENQFLVWIQTIQNKCFKNNQGTKCNVGKVHRKQEGADRRSLKC